MEKINITSVTSLMQGVGRLKDGRAAFVNGALVGEKVDINIIKEDKRFVTAEIANIDTISNRRVESDCPYYERCGGCALRHTDYPNGLDMKLMHVKDVLTRIGEIKNLPEIDVIPAENASRYRNKAEYAISGGRIGVYDKTGKSIIEVDDCLIQSEISINAMKTIRKYLTHENGYLVTRVNSAGEMSVTLSTVGPCPAFIKSIDIPNAAGIFHCRLNARPHHALDGRITKIRGKDTLNETLDGIEFEISPQSFFQVNTRQTEKLYARAIEYAELDKKTKLIDAYCGCGTISLFAARSAKRVLGVEIVSSAIENAKKNAIKNNLQPHTEFVCADAPNEIIKRISSGERFDCAIVDPPRKGCEAKLLSAFARSGIPKLVYVSCDPSSLARDLKQLTNDGYMIQKISCCDMFAFSRHIETVVLMSIKK